MSTTATRAALTTKPADWQVDPAHSAARFSVRHLMISNGRGEFSKLSRTVVIDPEDFAKSSVEVDQEAPSISTREPQRDQHLPSAGFLDVLNYPRMTLCSRRIAPADSHHFKLTGDLTIRGVTKEVSFDGEPPSQAAKDR